MPFTKAASVSSVSTEVMSHIPKPVSLFLPISFLVPPNVDTNKIQSTPTRHGITPLRSFGPSSARFITDNGLSHQWHATLYFILQNVIMEDWYKFLGSHMEQSGISTGDLLDGMYAAFLSDVGDVGISPY
jgi:hypothetical protein